MIIHNQPDALMQGYKSVSVGLRPSGSIHIGNILSLMQGMMAISADSSAKLDVRIMDLDFDFARKKEKDIFDSYCYITDNSDCHIFYKDHFSQQVGLALSDIANYLGVSEDRYSVNLFSPLTGDERFSSLLNDVFLNHTRLLFKSIDATAPELLSPNCPTCYTSPTSISKFSNVSGELYLQNSCANKYCETESFLVKAKDPKAVNIHFMVDPIRDLVLGADLHVFGGDYWERGRIRGIEKLLSGISSESPDLYVGPLIASQGVKMSKSAGPTLKYSYFKSAKNWPETIHKLLTGSPESQIETSQIKF